MQNLQKYIGRTKGVLTIVEILNISNNKKHIAVKCKCSCCGKESISRLDRFWLKAKIYEHYCPHCKEAYLIEQATKKYVGKTNGVLTCISVEGYKYNNKTNRTKLWLKCLCSHCGSETLVRADRFASTTQIPKSCEVCYYSVLGEATHKRYMLAHNTNDEKYYRTAQKLEAQLSKFKSGARHRNLVWELTDNEAKSIMEQPCYYCSSVPSYGIDRVNSKQGYSLSNVVSCCGMCNMMKNKFSKESFLQQIHRIYNNLHLEGSTTISKESTSQANGDGNGGCPEKGSDIV